MQFESEQQASLFDLMKSDLPNFPPELLYHWLLPLAADIGWPPGPNSFELAVSSRWKGILKYPLDFWQRVSWRLSSLNPDTLNFDEHTLKGLSDLIGAHAHGEKNLLGILMGESSRPRFFRQVNQLLAAGTFTEPPVIVDVGDRAALVDGNHRMAALAWTATDPAPRAVFERKGLCPVALPNEHQFWIGIPELGHFEDIDDL
ncbi:hypothetical protein [Pseudomonas peli]|mgnify:CR=1 FL=1|uniref:hypothetical protein n=1 Tax=Pseudomonas peli TaxID=592361 RepID=UPI0024AD649C|nr:hypothetical protein [Pseudomonas peli]